MEISSSIVQFPSSLSSSVPLHSHVSPPIHISPLAPIAAAALFDLAGLYNSTTYCVQNHNLSDKYASSSWPYSVKQLVEQLSVKYQPVLDLHSTHRFRTGIAKGTIMCSSATQRQKTATMDRTAVKKSALLMSLSMAFHFGGYEFARSSNLSLFTSKTAGFSNQGAFPLAMACVSPFSFLLLMGYGRELSLRGPRAALRNTGLFCAAFLSLAGGAASVLDNGEGGSSSWLSSTLGFSLPVLGELTLSKVLVWCSFIFQQSYAHLLYTQQWSFIGSILNAEEGAMYFSSIAGLSSISSTLAGTMLSVFVGKIGLAGLLGIASLSLVVSMLFADIAYDISEKNGFDPAEAIKRKKREQDQSKTSKKSEDVGLIKKTRDLFDRVPVLGALFGEVVSFQSLSTVLNVCLVTKLKEAISDDASRAAWTGQFYAAVNGLSGLFQFVVLPLFLKHIDPVLLWRSMPLLPLLCTLITSAQTSPSLNILACSFFAAKVMDYSLRNVLNEMIYVPLDFDSRYLGKEVIGVFGNRFGKSGISLVLSGLGYVFGSFGILELCRTSALASITWASYAYRLSNYVPATFGKGEAKAKGDKVS